MSKADDLRKQLRDARNKRTDEQQGTSIDDRNANETSQPVVGHFATNNTTDGSTRATEVGSANSSGPTVRSTQQPVQRQAGGTSGNDKPASNVKGKLASSSGSPPQVDRRSGQGGRRSGEDSSESGADGVDIREGVTTGPVVTRLGNLERNIKDEPFIPPRTFTTEREPEKETQSTEKAVVSPAIEKPKRGRPAGKRIIETAQSVISTIKPQQKDIIPEKETKHFSLPTPGKRLSQKEAEELIEPLTNALFDELELLDKAIWQLTKDEFEQPIWSDFTEKEMDSLVRSITRAGQRSATIATVARSATDLQDYIVAGAIVLPRLQRTAEAVKEARTRRKREHAVRH